MTDKREKPFKLEMPFGEALKRYAQVKPEVIGQSDKQIRVLSRKMPDKLIASKQASLSLSIEKDAEVGGIGMGVLSDGTPYLSQRGIAALCGVQNHVIGTISKEWTDTIERPRVKAIKAILVKDGSVPGSAHVEISHKGTVNFCYPADVCLALLEYYAFDAGQNVQREARDNFRMLAGSKLRELIFSQLGYNPANPKRFDKWHERIALNYQSAPKGYFHVFNEAHTIIYELVQAGAPIGDKMVVDISVGQHWSKHWTDSGLDSSFGTRQRYPHNYPDSHPQSKSNPQDSWCYPLSALGHYREWLQDTYIEGGKFAAYLKGKVARNEIPPSVAQLAIKAVVPAQIEGPPDQVSQLAS